MFAVYITLSMSDTTSLIWAEPKYSKQSWYFSIIFR